MRSGLLLSIRNKATRLPGKSFLDLAGASVTARLLERIRQSRCADVVAIATSTHPDDQVFADVARASGVELVCGSEDDKLARYRDAARMLECEIVIIVDGDDPCCDPGYIDRLIESVRREPVDYARVEGLPVGITASALRITALERVCELKSEHDTEVWGGYFTSNSLFSTRLLTCDAAHRRPDWRMTLDYPEDYDFFRAVFSELHRPGLVFSLDEIVSLLDRRPDIVAINRAASAWYEANLQRITRTGMTGGTA